MNLLHPHLLLADGQIQFIGGIVFVIALIGIMSFFKDRERQRRHEAVLKALEKGMPVPEVLTPPPAPAVAETHKKRADLIIAGTVNIGVGIGLYLLFAAMGG
jgi:Domain of unknown function (DUF6249)